MKKILIILLILLVGVSAYTITTFNDSATSKTFNFTEDHYTTQSNSEMWVDIPGGSTLISAYFPLTGNPIANWTRTTSGTSVEPLYDIQMLSATEGYALGIPPGGGGGGGGGNQLLTFFKWNGTAWADYIAFDAYKFDLLNSNFGFAINGSEDNNDDIWFYDGSTWTLNQSVLINGVVKPTEMGGIDIYNETLAFVVGYRELYNASIFKFNGTEWTQDALPAGTSYVEILRDVKFINSTLAYAVGDCGYIIKWNGSEWLNDTNAGDTFNNDLFSIDSYGNNLAFAVGQDFQIAKWDGTTWANETTNPYGYGVNSHHLYDVDIGYTNRATAVGDWGEILEWDGSTWDYSNEYPLVIEKTFYGVSDVEGAEHSLTFAVGENLSIARYWGYPNLVSLGEDDGGLWWNQTGTELKSQVGDLTDMINDNCEGEIIVCNQVINLTIVGPGSVTVGVNITYSTSSIVPDGLVFKLENGSDVSVNPVGENSTVFVFNGSVLTASIPIDFSIQPNYTGWFSEAGFNLTNNHACVNASSLDDAGNSMNTSLKTLYLLKKNVSLGSVCLIDAAVSIDILSDIVNNSHCTNTQVEGVNGTVHNDYLTEEIGGQIYFVIPDVVNSGVVQIVNFGGTGNPPSFDVVAVNPSSGDSDTSFVFTATVYDLDNDSVGVEVVIGGITYSLTPVDSESTVNGKDFSLTTPLPTGVFSYYFKASDGSNIVTTTTYTGLTVGIGTPVIVSAPGFNFMWVILLFFIAIVIFNRLKKSC